MKFYFTLFAICLCSFQGKAFSQLEHVSNKDSLSIEEYLKSQNIDADVTTEGLYYAIEQFGEGKHPEPGDYVMVKFKGALMNGNVFDESKEDEPFVFQLGYRQVILGWELGIPLFQVGSKGKIFVPAELGYGRTGAGRTIPPDASLIFDIEVLEIMDFAAYDAYMVKMEKRARAKFEAQKKKQFKTDKKLIHEYAIDHKLKAKRLPSGVSYVITKKGKGDTAKPGDFLEVHYEGFLTNDESFDASSEKKPYKFQLGKKKVIAGWEDGLQKFKKGSEGWLLIPSQLAYGPRSIEEDNISIPGNSVLIFKIKVVSIKSPEPTAGK